ncbi:MAG TPA: TIGR03435 family protein [Acidobacteriaceae bacterium]|nr:TIGR03435 family protein [Acidobacteriaceae bacterium]
MPRFTILAAWIVLGLGCRPSTAQNDSANQQFRDPDLMAKDADPGWEAVTVKPSVPNDPVSHINISGRHVMVEGQSIEGMLRFAYGVQHSQVVDAPEWMRTARWDVSGVPDAPGKPNLPQFQSMMRKLLAERFGLTLHREQRTMPVFALTLAKGGPKLEKSTGDPNAGPGSGGGALNGIESHRYTNTSMSALALMLMIYTDRPIVDQTGLQGRYDFQLRWARDETQPTAADAPPGLFTAIQEQLGLKLEPTKAPADVLVIDKVERPDAN